MLSPRASICALFAAHNAHVSIAFIFRIYLHIVHKTKLLHTSQCYPVESGKPREGRIDTLSVVAVANSHETIGRDGALPRTLLQVTARAAADLRAPRRTRRCAQQSTTIAGPSRGAVCCGGRPPRWNRRLVGEDSRRIWFAAQRASKPAFSDIRI